MTLLTRKLRPVVVLLAVSTCVAGVAGPLGVAAHASDGRPVINQLNQHYSATSYTTAGQRRDANFYGQWDTDGNATPSILLTGANDMARYTSFSASSPAPVVARRQARGYCITQAYYARALEPATASASYRTTVVVRRHGRVVYRHSVAHAYIVTSSPTGIDPGRAFVQHDRGRFHFRHHDRVTWSISGRLTNQIKKFRSAAVISSACKS